MKTVPQTKNLVILYQKLFNLGLSKCKAMVSDKNSPLFRINIRRCSSMNSFKVLLCANPILKDVMQEMLEHGQLLETLVKFKEQFCNMAISLKYLNRLANLIKHPEVKNITWTEQAQEPQAPVQGLLNFQFQSFDSNDGQFGTDPKYRSKLSTQDANLGTIQQQLADFFQTDDHDHAKMIFTIKYVFPLCLQELGTMGQGSQVAPSEFFEDPFENLTEIDNSFGLDGYFLF